QGEGCSRRPFFPLSFRRLPPQGIRKRRPCGMLERMFDLARLTAEQRRAATHDGGNLLIAAGAGTGKTTTVAARLAHLVSSGVAPERILLLTFSRRAAAELLQRAEQVTGREVAAAAWGGTFHAIANRLLRRHGRAIGV